MFSHRDLKPMTFLVCILWDIHWSYKICYFGLVMSGIDSQSIRLSDVSNLKNWKTIWGSKLIFCHHWSYEKYCAVLGYGPKKVLANQFAECFAFDLFDLLILRLGVHCYIPLADSGFNCQSVLVQLTDLNLKWRWLIQMILSLLAFREISVIEF